MIAQGSRHTIADAMHVVIAEDSILSDVGPVAGLFDVGRRETVGVSFVVDQLIVHVVPNLRAHKFSAASESSRYYSHVVLNEEMVNAIS